MAGFTSNRSAPTAYTVRVWASTFVPASRQNVPVKAGMESLLAVQLASFFSSIEVVSTLPAGGGLVSDDWKWAMRSDPALRPVLRMSPGLPDLTGVSSSERAERMMRGVVQLSGGETDPDLMGAVEQPGDVVRAGDVGFRIARTAIQRQRGLCPGHGGAVVGLPDALLQPSGNAPAPDIEFTVRQLGLGERAGQALITGPGAAQEMPTLRSYSMNLQNGEAIGDRMRLEYGLMLEAVEFIDHLNLLSPLRQVGVRSGSEDRNAGDGVQRRRAGIRDAHVDGRAAATDALADLTSFPRVSLLDSQARLQRAREFEGGYRYGLGKTTVRASAYREFLSNQAFMVSGDTSKLPSTDLLPDLGSNSSIYNFGNFATSGYLLSATRPLSDQWNFGASFGQGGALHTDKSLGLTDFESLRSGVRMSPTKWFSTRLNGTLPGSGTHISLAYIWTPTGQVIPTHTFLTQEWQPSMGLNFQLRQPLPAITGIGGRFEVTAEVRNLLAQGYVPVPSSDGRNMLLVPFPRSLRGGLSFIF